MKVRGNVQAIIIMPFLIKRTLLVLNLKMLTKRCYICRKFKFCVFLNHGSPENVKINRVVEDLLIYYIYILCTVYRFVMS